MGASSSNITISNNNENRILIPEALIEDHEEPISKYKVKRDLPENQSKKIIKQMEKSICLIDHEDSKGTGFLCLIPYPNINHFLRVLITCNHVLNNLTIGNKIKLIFDNEKPEEINIDKNRRTYTNEEHDITIIELKENEFDNNDYLEIDDLIYEENELDNIYKNKKIYIIHYPKGDEVRYSCDTITNIENNIIEHCCTTDKGSSGAPILNLDNYQVIGIHMGYYKYENENENINFGEIIKLVIDDFNKDKNNYIIAEIEIKEEEINKDIRIINSY